MKLMFPKTPFVAAMLTLFILSLTLTGSLSAQSRKKASVKKAVAQKTVAKKSDKHAKDARKESERSKLAKRDNKKEKLTAKEKAKAREKEKADARAAKDPKKRGESKKEAAERRRKEEERRRAALAEQRRREEAARIARERKLAFERGLRTETVANIQNDKTDGEDLNIRQAAVNALGGHAGSVVVMEAQTGKVLTIVNQDWAIRSSIKPCSTIKLVTGVAGLNEGVINKEDGSIHNTPTRRDLDDAIAFSDNGYFQRVGSNVGNAKMIDYAKRLGLGEPTGLNADGESSGKLAFGNNNARIYSHGDDFEVTGLQLAVLVSEITNGGNRVIPRVPRNSVEKTKFQTFYRAKLDLPQQNVRRMIPGMMGAAAYGTAHRNMDQSLGVAGKTGSCISKGSWVGLFASVAPIEKPKYSVVVITRGQSERGKYAAAVAAQVYRSLATGIVRTDRNLAETEFHIKPKYDARTAAKIADASDEEDDDATAASTSDDSRTEMSDVKTEGQDVIVVPSATRERVVEKPTPKKLVTRTVNSKPVFPPVVITFDKDGKEKKTPTRSKPE